MANFPTSLPASTPTADDLNDSDDDLAGTAGSLVSHPVEHGRLTGELLAVATKVGVDSSAVTTSHDYKITQLEAFQTAIAETIRDTIGTALTAGANIQITVSDVNDTITVAVTGLASTDLSDFAEAVDDRVATLVQDGTGIAWTYSDVGGTLTGNVSLAAFDTDDLAEGTNLYHTTERVQDVVGAMVAAGSGLTATYSDAAGTLTISFTADMATQAELDAHLNDTTSVHGITDTSALETTTGAQTKVDTHVNDATAAHAASAVSVDSTGLVGTGTDAQTVLGELDDAIVAVETSVADHLADTADAHDASAISILDAAADFTATDVEGALAELQADHETDAAALTTHAADTTTHGTTGNIVGTTDTQTLTGKTLALGSNTVSGTVAQFNTALTDGDFVVEDTSGDVTLDDGVLSGVTPDALLGGVLRNVSAIQVDNTYIQADDPGDDPAIGTGLFLNYDVTLNQTGPALVGPQASTSQYSSGDGANGWGPRALISMEGRFRYNTSTGGLGATPQAGICSIIVGNTPAQAVSLTPYWGWTNSAVYVADGATVTQRQPEGGFILGPVGFMDVPTYVTENAGIWDADTNNVALISFCSLPFLVGNTDMDRRFALEVMDINQYSADMGEVISGVTEMGITSDVTASTLNLQAGVHIHDLDFATTNLSIYSEGADVQMRHVGPAVFGADAAQDALSRYQFTGSTTHASPAADAAFVLIDPAVSVSGSGFASAGLDIRPVFTLTAGTELVRGVNFRVDVSAASAQTSTGAVGLDALCVVGDNATVTEAVGVRSQVMTASNTGPATATTGVGIDITVQELFGLGVMTTGVLLRGLTNSATTTKWGFQFGNFQSYHHGPLTVGTNAAPATSALVDLVSTTKALIVSRMTTTQRDALTAVNGMIIYNTTTNAFNFRENGAWVAGSALA